MDIKLIKQLQKLNEEEVPQTYPSGRRCKYQGCSTKLSTYNPNAYCFKHAGVKSRQSMDRQTAKIAGEAPDQQPPMEQ